MARRSRRETEYLDNRTQSAILRRIQTQIEEESQLSASPTQKALDALMRKYSGEPTQSKPPTRIKSVTYEMLPDILPIAKLSIRDMYEDVGISIEWSDKEARDLAVACARLSKPALMECKRMALSSSPSFWQTEPDFVRGCPSYRTQKLLNRRYGFEERREIVANVDEELAAFWERDRKTAGGYTPIPTTYLPALARELGVSLHWLMKQDGLASVATQGGACLMDTTGSQPPRAKRSVVLAKNYDIEMIITAFMFMPEGVRAAFKDAVCGAAREEMKA